MPGTRYTSCNLGHGALCRVKTAGIHKNAHVANAKRQCQARALNTGDDLHDQRDDADSLGSIPRPIEDLMPEIGGFNGKLCPFAL
ncbi:hypothetical protein N7478_002760 [Penicillium angulare]|uniref:uncharacterized protein n=1 Tax=Penicillium angulare TaxID=116970 RepID=UPI00253F989D|nr:uncharacterized protein N7478_002760 [Penicillium angulare]KAJ5287074.1 hypothetical protein N7478_002760 [Penicillium angulare]